MHYRSAKSVHYRSAKSVHYRSAKAPYLSALASFSVVGS